MSPSRYSVVTARIEDIALHEARGREAALRRALLAAGLPWPERINRRAEADGRAVVRLGPTRVLILCALADETAMTDRLETAFAAEPEADVAVATDMHVGFAISGAGAEDVLRQGAPLDLDRTVFPAGMATGTDLFGVGVILGRTAEDGFQLFVERSFADYVEGWLATAAGLPSTLRPGVMVRPPARIVPS